MQKTQRSPAPLTVLYDGECPFCSREIAWYQRLDARCAIDWADLPSDREGRLPADLAREAALARLHVVLPDGRVRSGAAAIITLWSHLKPLRPLARLAAIPPLPWLLEWASRGFLRLRPRLQPIARGHIAQPVYPRWLDRDLRSDHAGESAAVAIYRGMLAVSRDADLRRFARRHLRTELRHLRKIDAVLPADRRSRLLPLW